ncbi:MAG: type II secretion system secretin GspD [Methylococcales bacterium]|nr:type II secretion system secretin GspD [Methylococcales bacterium]
MINRIEHISFLLILSLLLIGCEFLGPKPFKKLPLEATSKSKQIEQLKIEYQELTNELSESVDDSRAKVELYPGTGQFFSQRGGRSQRKASEKGEYSLNFDAADLGEVAKVILTDILDENYVLSPKVSGQVTLQTSKPLSRAELLPTLEMLLQINNAAMVYQNGVYQIRPATEVVSSSSFGAGKRYSKKIAKGYQVRVIPVKNVAVAELVKIVKPLMSNKAILHADENRNILLIAGTAAELARAIDIVNSFDVNVMKGRSFGLFSLINVEAEQMIKELEQVFNQKTSGSGRGLYQFMAIERLNAILAITHQAKHLKDIERWVFRLDKANTSAGGGVIVYRAQHVDAVELATTLGEIFGQGNKPKRPASIASGRKQLEVTNKNKKVDTATTNRVNSVLSLANLGDVKIIADEVNNALIIMASAQDYAVVQRVIKQLDVMPLQVLIDVSIVDVSLNDELEYGIRWFFEHNNGQNAGATNPAGLEEGVFGGADLTNLASSLAIGAATGGFGYGFVSGSGDIRAVLNMESTKGNINVISSPSLMVLNNQEASIQVGEEVSLRTSESTPLTGGVGEDNSPISTTTFQQRKTGVTVNVKPRVNASGLVIMEIEQRVEDFAVKNGVNGNPDILTREINSSVAIQSGETIVLGGLINEKNTIVKTGIPFLHEIPLIGPLFGSTEKIKRKTELVVLITPRVVKTRQDARLITNEFKRKLSGIYEQTEEPLNTAE